MILICTIEIIVGIFFTKADVEGKMLRQNEQKYYVDFSEALKINKWRLPISDTGKALVNKSDCIVK